jgi:pyrophosphatase PpaX
MELKGIIFDLDGTLGNTFPVIFPALRYTLKKITGLCYTDQELAATFGPTEEGILQNLAPDHWQKCLHVYMERYKQLSPLNTQRFPGIEQALQALKQRNILLGVVTGKSITSALISLEDLGLSGYFDIVKGGSDAGSIKAACMHEVLEIWGLPPKQVAYIGDVASDMHYAKEVGLIPLGAAWYEQADYESLEEEHPLAVFRRVRDFIHWIESDHH